MLGNKILKERVLQFYQPPELNEKLIVKINEEIREYSKLKICLLYFATIVDENILGIYMSAVTCLAMNILTSLISFQESSIFDLIIWILKFVFAVILNICIVKFYIRCAILQEEDKKNHNNGMPKIERLKSLLKEYNLIYEKMKKDAIMGIVSFFVLFCVMIFYPLGKMLTENWGVIKNFMNSLIICLVEYF